MCGQLFEISSSTSCFKLYYLLKKVTPCQSTSSCELKTNTTMSKFSQKKSGLLFFTRISCVQNFKHGSLQRLDVVKGHVSLKGQPNSKLHSYRFEIGCQKALMSLFSPLSSQHNRHVVCVLWYGNF